MFTGDVNAGFLCPGSFPPDWEIEWEEDSV
jgi:hypothetical protein